MRRVYRAAVFLVFCSLFSSSALAFQPNDNSERIMKVILTDGTIMEEALVCHQRQGVWMLPLRALTESLGIAIQVSSEFAKAEGFVLQEKRKFRLDQASCQAEHHERTEKFACESVVLYEDDLYIQSGLLENWFPIRMQFNPFRSEIVVDPLESLPLQAFKERARRPPQTAPTSSDPGYPRQPITHEWLEGPSLDQQFSFYNQAAGGSTQTFLQHDSSLTGQFLGTDALLYMGGTQASISRTRVTLSQKSPEGGLFGPYINAKDVQIIDVNLPPIHMISLGGLGRGFSISSRPIYLPTDFSNQDFTGILLPGWEVQLFRNGLLIDRKISDGSGKYLFTNVPLQYGKNEFLLSYYGPQGQRKEEPKTVWVGSDLVLPAQSYYRLGVSGLGDSTNKIVLDYSKSLFKNLTLTGGYSRLQLAGNTDYTNYGVVGFNTYALGILGSAWGSASSGGGKGLETSLRTSVLGANLGVTYTRLIDGFQSEVYPIKQGRILVGQERADLAYALKIHPPIAMNWEVSQNHYEDQTQEFNLVQRTSTVTGPIHWNHELNYLFNISGPTITGKLNPFVLIWGGQIRAGLTYTTQMIQGFEAEWQKTFGDRTTLKTNFTRHFDLNTSKVLLGISRPIGKFLSNINVTYSDPLNYVFGLFFSYSLTRDKPPGSWHLDPYPQAEGGSVSVLVFVDKNRNGKLDGQDVVLSRVAVRTHQSNQDFLTDENGVAFIPHLMAYSPVDVNLSIGSLNDPFLKPALPGVRVYPQPGKVVRVQIPVYVTGEIDGKVGVLIPALKKKTRGIVLELTSPSTERQTVTTDREGNFLFESIPPGTYTLKISNASLKKLNIFNVTPREFEVTIPVEGSFESGKDFIIE